MRKSGVTLCAKLTKMAMVSVGLEPGSLTRSSHSQPCGSACACACACARAPRPPARLTPGLGPRPRSTRRLTWADGREAASPASSADSSECFSQLGKIERRMRNEERRGCGRKRRRGFSPSARFSPVDFQPSECPHLRRPDSGLPVRNTWAGPVSAQPRGRTRVGLTAGRKQSGGIRDEGAGVSP